MINNIKQTIKILDYPKVDKIKGESLSMLEIESAIKKHKNQFQPKFQENEKYYIGRNAGIEDKTETDAEAPDSRVVTPYARTMTNIVKGYMYQAGLINYSSENEALMDEVNRVFQYNEEQLENSELGEHQSKFGIGFEIMWNEADDQNKAIVRFRYVDPREMIPITNYTVDDELIAVIRYYEVQDEANVTDSTINTRVDTDTIIDVYYDDRIEHYKQDSDGNMTEREAITPHLFGDIPVTIFVNNNEYSADYEPVKSLIDMYDELMSSSANESARFAAAYLVMKNYILAGNEDDRANRLQEMKELRVFEVNEDGEIKFLTKDIPSEYGWKTALKPAQELITVAMKPIDGTYVNNALKWGVAGLNIDGGRIGENPNYKYNADKNGTIFHGEQGKRIKRTADKNGQQFIESNKGRYPSNIILDEEAAKLLDDQSGILKSGDCKNNKMGGVFGNGKKIVNEFKGDKGGASRYFYVAKPSQDERNYGLDEMQKKQQSHDGREKPIENAYQRNETVSENFHPTVKPVKLMEYLCKLTATPTGGVVLDPFAGSGTTGIGAIMAGREYILIEREEEYIPIIEARLAAWKERKICEDAKQFHIPDDENELFKGLM